MFLRHMVVIIYGHADGIPWNACHAVLKRAEIRHCQIMSQVSYRQRIRAEEMSPPAHYRKGLMM